MPPSHRREGVSRARARGSMPPAMISAAMRAKWWRCSAASRGWSRSARWNGATCPASGHMGSGENLSGRRGRPGAERPCGRLWAVFRASAPSGRVAKTSGRFWGRPAPFFWTEEMHNPLASLARGLIRYRRPVSGLRCCRCYPPWRCGGRRGPACRCSGALGTSIGERLALVPAPAYEHHAQAGQHRAAEHSRTEVSTAL